MHRGDITAQVTQQASESSINRDSPQSLSWCHLIYETGPVSKLTAAVLSMQQRSDNILFMDWGVHDKNDSNSFLFNPSELPRYVYVSYEEFSGQSP